MLSLIVAGLAYRRDALAGSGVVGAVLIGSLVFGFGGLVWGIVLVAFFASSSLLSRFHRTHKAVVSDVAAKGSRRDLAQVLANGSCAAMVALLAGTIGRDGVTFSTWLFIAFLGAVASANADTWATELGLLTRHPPRLITSGRPVSPGTSGGVTPAGMAASLGGAAFIGCVALATAWFMKSRGYSGLSFGVIKPLAVLAVTTAAGFLGALVDSLLGASWQAAYRCDACGLETERPIHRCGRESTFVRGWRWLNNDWVNFVSSIAGATVAYGLGLFAYNGQY